MLLLLVLKEQRDLMVGPFQHELGHFRKYLRQVGPILRDECFEVGSYGSVFVVLIQEWEVLEVPEMMENFFWATLFVGKVYEGFLNLVPVGEVLKSPEHLASTDLINKELS